MSGWGTDVVAVACIVGGAAVSGGATLFAMRGGEQPARCEMQAVAVPQVVVRMGDGGAVRVRPQMVRLRSEHGCAVLMVGGEGTEVRLDEARARMEDARVRIERARGRVDAARVRSDAARARADAVRARADATRIRADALRKAMDEVRAQAGTVRTDEIRARLQEELARMEKELAALDEGTGGR